LEIEFFDPGEVPLPPDEVGFRAFVAEPLADGRRVRLHLSVTPFQQRPSIEVEILGPDQQRVALTQIVEAVDVNMSLTMHLRGESGAGEYLARASLYYPPQPPVDQAEAAFQLPPAGSSPPG
jgi:hypothetical protein